MEQKNRESSEPYYDLIDDFDLILSSFQSQYGLRLSKELETMKWSEFVAMLSGLGPKTPLGRIVSIRAEDDKEVLKHFSKEQLKIRSDYRNKMAKAMPKAKTEDFLEQMKQALIDMAGGVNN